MSNKNKPILITGCARSGTSITAGIVFYCGAFGGKMTGATRHNKKGQFENKTIRDQLVKPYLISIDCDPLGQSPLPDINNLIIDPAWKQKVLKIIKTHGYNGKDIWFYKGAKMCLFWPMWHKAFPNAKWIIVRRDPDDIVNSCMKTGFMRAYKKPDGWYKWVNEHTKRFDEMHNNGLDIVEVWPSKIIGGMYGEIKSAIAHVGLKWNRDVVHDFITPRLWSGKIDSIKKLGNQ